MSALATRAALETALDAMTPALETAWENAKFSPTPGSAYQRVAILLAPPVMMEMSHHWHREAGFMQVTLCYPLDAGAGAALTRAEAIRTTFHAGATFTASGVTVHVDGTPEIGPAMIEDDTYALPVRVRFYSHVLRS